MKILGLTYHAHEAKMYLKPDSALLVNDKPFFAPSFTKQVEMHPCVVVRVCRLGKNIEPRFACRYYDALTVGLNMQAADVLEQAIADSQPWTQAVAFDNSLIVGRMCELSDGQPAVFSIRIDEQPVLHLSSDELLLPIDEAVSRLSSVVSIRMGDMIAVDFRTQPLPAIDYTKVQGMVNNQLCFTCKIR